MRLLGAWPTAIVAYVDQRIAGKVDGRSRRALGFKADGRPGRETWNGSLLVQVAAKGSR